MLLQKIQMYSCSDVRHTSVFINLHVLTDALNVSVPFRTDGEFQFPQDRFLEICFFVIILRGPSNYSK